MSQHKVERSDSIVVAALYKFVRLGDFEQLREPLLALMLAQDVRGTLLLANEGINGTIAGPRAGIDTVLGWLREDPRLADLEHKESFHDAHPFLRTKVKLKKEIVTMGVEGIDPNRTVGTYLSPQEWNAVISDPETLLIDTRNDYEVEVGTFKGAINPETRTFREFPEYVKETLDPARHKKVAMFCTGGIRCEKSTAYLKEQGFDEVIVSTGDKDMAQLVNDKVRLVDTMKNAVMTRDAVFEKFGVYPEQIVDYLTLVGDTVDNVPGVEKVGPKTAAKWLAEYKTLDGVVANADKIGGKVGENLQKALDWLPTGKTLVTIKTD